MASVSYVNVKACQPRPFAPQEQEVFDSLPDKQEWGIVSKEGIIKARARIGTVEPGSRPPFNEVASKDAMRKCAQAIGDNNPLYWNEEYGKNTRWGSIIGSPTFFHSMGVSVRTEPLSPEERAEGGGALTGVQGWYSGERTHWFRPVRPGDKLFERRYVYDVYPRRSSFSAVTVHRWDRRDLTNQNGELVTHTEHLIISGGRERRAGERRKYADLEPARYSTEDIARIHADYDQHIAARRGATPRYWEDVNEGDECTPVVVGPLTINDMILWDVGYGMTMFDGSGDWMHEYYRRHPAALPIRPNGVPETVERVHWSEDLGFMTGNPLGAYDYGEQRCGWLPRAVTNWMGDDAWLHYFYGEWRLFVYSNGDSLWITGKVSRKYIEDGECKVDLQIGARDQRGRETAPGTATVILPSRQYGPVQIPPKGLPEEFR